MEIGILVVCIISGVFSLIVGIISVLCFARLRKVNDSNAKNEEQEEKLLRTLKENGEKQTQELFSFSRGINESLNGSLKLQGEQVSKSLDRMSAMLGEGTKNNASAQETLYRTVESRLDSIRQELYKTLSEVKDSNSKAMEKLREDNAAQLDKLREVVDEKLHKSLEERLTQSFAAITEKLEKVRDGFTEMQNLSKGVTDLKKVLGGIKTRGTWGETSLKALLEDLLSPEQYTLNEAIKPNKVVEFCILLPGNGERLLLPVDSKFPLADYQRLAEAADSGDATGLAEAKKNLETRIKAEAKDINEYVYPPKTTDFAIMYLPIEGLYAEISRNSALVDDIRRKYKVIISGPSTFSALLNSLQVGFRTMALQRNSMEIQKLLTSFRTEFGRFISLLKKSEEQAFKLSDTLSTINKKSQTIDSRLSKLELIEAEPSVKMIAADTADDDS